MKYGCRFSRGNQIVSLPDGAKPPRFATSSHTLRPNNLSAVAALEGVSKANWFREVVPINNSDDNRQATGGSDVEAMQLKSRELQGSITRAGKNRQELAILGASNRFGKRVWRLGKIAKARLLLADGEALIVEAFSKLLEPEFEIVGTVTNGLALLHEAARLKPDVVVLDLNLPKLNGRDAGKEIRKILPRAKIVVVTIREDFQSAVQSLEQWASAYLLKRSTASELIQAIRLVLKGKAYVTPCVAQRLFEEFVRNPNA